MVSEDLGWLQAALVLSVSHRVIGMNVLSMTYTVSHN